MGIFGSNFTLWKSAADQEKEQEEYRRWAFPYGEKQQESLKSLLTAVFSKKDNFIMFTFLTIKEMYDKAYAEHGSQEEAVEAIVAARRKTKLQIIRQLKKDDLFKYLAIVVADRNVDMQCEYPSAEEIFESAEKIRYISDEKQ